MKKTKEDAALIAHNQLYQAFEPGTDAPRRDDDRPMAVSSGDRRTNYRVWQCNGVTIGVRILKSQS